MRRSLPAVVLVAVAVLLAAAGAVSAAQVEELETSTAAVSVELDKSNVTAGPGERVSFKSVLRNTGDQPISGLIAHLNVLSSDPDVYVDPEDWSPRRTQFLDELPAGQSTQLSWDVQAVTAGPLILFVAVTLPHTNEVVASGQLKMMVEGQREVDAAGVLPLVVGVPSAVLVLLGLVGLRRRRFR
jgi:hypothetical protein